MASLTCTSGVAILVQFPNLDNIFMIQSWENFEFSRKELFDEIVGCISFIDAFNGAVLAQFAAESRTDFRIGALERFLFYALTMNNCNMY